MKSTALVSDKFSVSDGASAVIASSVLNDIWKRLVPIDRQKYDNKKKNIRHEILKYKKCTVFY